LSDSFIKNFPYETNEKEMGDKFRSCGKIKDIRFVLIKKIKYLKDYAILNSKNIEAW